MAAGALKPDFMSNAMPLASTGQLLPFTCSLRFQFSGGRWTHICLPVGVISTAFCSSICFPVAAPILLLLSPDQVVSETHNFVDQHLFRGDISRCSRHLDVKAKCCAVDTCCALKAVPEDRYR